MGGDRASASCPACPQGKQRKEAQTRSGRIEWYVVGATHGRAVVRTSQAIPAVPDLPSEVSGVGAAESVPEDSSGTGATHATERINESCRMLH